jgi:hypothetical protein
MDNAQELTVVFMPHMLAKTDTHSFIEGDFLWIEALYVSIVAKADFYGQMSRDLFA